ncbi:2-hydroxyacid dehydrogenase [Sphingomonas montanisoli]|uniref:2-hydroxyacid dehydrogenase n=1 Tax=Sphingomonas montanisoli TaxID=2606412 RepID=A0A5D9C3M7_9SPHN|nr:2-hydroxyacid dehydrogenase [Sphingomonas montanisoli]TZG26126.1 2-hydroxyacid dehydrogenase [Sphingomonas montanisoli]
MTKPPLYYIDSSFAVPRLTDGLKATYDLRPEPGPGIRAVATHGSTGIDAATMAKLPDLEMIAVSAVGVDKVDLAEAKRRGIHVTNTPDVLTDDVADLAIGLMIALYRNIPRDDALVRSGRWASEGMPTLSRRLTGQRIGILGLGRIGQAIAKRAAPFAGEIAYHSRHPVADVSWRYAESAMVLAASVDILIVATPGGPATDKLVDATVIDALGPNGSLINIARGSVVDEDALVAALVEGRLGGAGLDVFAHEPHVPAALLPLPNVVLLPHQGSATVETRDAMAQLVLDNLAAFFAGQPLLTPL